jgi:NADPH-dependent ferric siderophore reductase
MLSFETKPRKPRYPAIVKRVEQITPRTVRITFTSPELAAFGWNGPAAHIKLIFPSAPDASIQSTSETKRTYTPRRFDRAAGELDVEFVLHGDGPAATWAAQAAVGQALTIGGPGRNYSIDTLADWFVLAGDDTAIPAIATILEALPASARVFVFLEVVDAMEERELESRANVRVTWLHRGPDATSAGAALENALRGADLPQGSGRVYVACEAGAVRRIRRHLLVERGLDREFVVTRGYWKLGATDHPDRDYGED